MQDKYLFRYLLLITILHFAVLCCFSLSKLWGFGMFGEDSGVFDQLLWTARQGQLPFTTQITHSYGAAHLNWFGYHFSPILLLLAPLQAIFYSPEMLQVITIACLSFSVFPIYFTLLRLLQNQHISFAFSLFYLLNLYLLSAAMWDFHEQILAVPLIATGILALVLKRFKMLCFILFFMALCKEHYGLNAVGFGLLWGWHNKEWKKGLALAIAGLAVFILTITVIMPQFAGGALHPMLQTHSGEGSHLNRFHWLTNPETAISDTLPKGFMLVLMYSFVLLTLFFFLPIFSPLWLLPALADFLVNAGADNMMMKTPMGYHSITLLPAIIIASAMGCKNLQNLMIKSFRTHPSFKKLSAIMLTILLVLHGICFAAMGLGRLYHWQPHGRQPAIAEIKQLLKPEDKVVADMSISYFFSQRSDILVAPAGLPYADTFIFLLEEPEYQIFWQEKKITQKEYALKNKCRYWKSHLADAQLNLHYWQKPFLVLSKRPSSLNIDKTLAMRHLETLCQNTDIYNK